MTNEKITKRLVYLADEFKIFEPSELEVFIEEAGDGVDIEFVRAKMCDEVLAIKKTSLINSEKGRYKTTIHVSDLVFADMVDADPTEHKEHLQWMLTVFRNIIKDKKISNDKARQFAEEDLKLANKYLKLFINNKKKKKFKDLCTHGFGIPKTDPSNINQYSSLSQLFDAVDPFIERTPSTLEKAMQQFADAGQAKMAFRDRKWTVFIPYTQDANCVMQNFAGWCTAQSSQSMFSHYTKTYKGPKGKDSTIYVIINNELFEGKTDECYQIHFETNQIKGRDNSYQNINIYEPVLSTSEGITEFFKEELSNLAKISKEQTRNVYIDYLIKFGFSEALFDMIDENVPVIKFENIEMPKLPDISKFKQIDELMLLEINLVNLHPSIGELNNLELISVPNNKIKELPKEIGNLKNLVFINITGNPIQVIPEEIRFLDKSNGGSLYGISVNETDMSKENYLKLKRLLPTTKIGSD